MYIQRIDTQTIGSSKMGVGACTEMGAYLGEHGRMSPMILIMQTIQDVVIPTGAQVYTSTDQKHTYSKDVGMCTNESEKGSGKREPSE